MNLFEDYSYPAPEPPPPPPPPPPPANPPPTEVDELKALTVPDRLLTRDENDSGDITPVGALVTPTP